MKTAHQDSSDLTPPYLEAVGELCRYSWRHRTWFSVISPVPLPRGNYHANWCDTCTPQLPVIKKQFYRPSCLSQCGLDASIELLMTHYRQLEQRFDLSSSVSAVSQYCVTLRKTTRLWQTMRNKLVVIISGPKREGKARRNCKQYESFCFENRNNSDESKHRDHQLWLKPKQVWNLPND